MTRALDLGPAGEKEARRLGDLYLLTPAFELCVVLSPYPRALDELRRRMAEQAGRLVHWPPSLELLPRAVRLAEELPPSVKTVHEERPVVWIQQEKFDPGDWHAAAETINWKRESFLRTAPWLWVLAGPEELLSILRQEASDIMPSVVTMWFRDEPKLKARPAPPRRPLRWLHLSDFHFRGLERWDRRATLQALLRHAGKLKEEGRRPDFVFATGDVAFSGKHEEYEQAGEFFTKLAETLGLDPAKHFFFVPGNHDVDRSAIRAEEHILAGLQRQEQIEEVLGDAAVMKTFARRLEAFYAFTERFFGPARGWPAERPWRVDLRDVEGVEVAVLQLNSAWASGANDERGLLVGEAQLREALQEAEDAYLRIVLVHHPLADLRDVDRERLEGLFGTGEVHFLLRGHLHRNRTLATTSPDDLLVELAAGAVYPDGKHPKTHLFTEVDLGAGTARVSFFRYSDEGRGFWAPDTLAHERARDGVWTFDLPAQLKLDDGAAPASTAEMSDARRATLTARYRAAAAAVHGTVRFAGYDAHRPRPSVQVPELFVPLRLDLEGHCPRFSARGASRLVPVQVWLEQHAFDQRKGESWTTVQLLSRLFTSAEVDKPFRAVVLGDPGSGKTTLCRFAAVFGAGKVVLEGKEHLGESLPLFLAFREYVRTCNEEGDRSLLQFLEEQTHNQLQVAAPDGFVEKAIEEGRAVLLLDGLDEVGSAAEREKMRERVQGFCASYPNLPVLVTSRIAGYDDAPLARRGPESFFHLWLTPFTDEDLREFVKHWYGVQEPEDPLARDEGIAGLVAALEADPRVQELARNPMLATLIALVHRYEAHLPGERAALYDICIKTLLETWPASRRREFREIDSRLQRVHLEALALRMQESRTAGASEVVIGREELVETLTDIVLKRSSAEPEKTRGIVERWVRHLAQETGLVVEQRPGVFSFLHLSLMEYLAARGLDATEESLADGIARRYEESMWLEVCLLAVGSRALDKPFLNRLYEIVAEKEDWRFLLRCMREEADFDDEQKAAILRAAVLRLLEPSNLSTEDQVLNAVMRFSSRHAQWTKAWAQAELASARGQSLQAIVVLVGNDDICTWGQSTEEDDDSSIVNQLKDRTDADRVAADLVDFGPWTNVGRWAIRTMSHESALSWPSPVIPDELMVVRALAAITQGAERLALPLVPALARSATRFAAAAKVWAHAVENYPRPGGRGLPPTIRTQAGVVVTTDAICAGEPPDTVIDILGERFFAKPFTENFTRCLAYDLNRWNDAMDFEHEGGFSEVFCHDFTGGSAQNLWWNVTRSITSFGQYFEESFVPHATLSFFRFLDDDPTTGSDLDLNHVSQQGEPRGRHLLPPKTEPSTALKLRDEAVGTGREILRWYKVADTWRLAEAWVGFASTLNRPAEERIAYVTRRLTHAASLHIWPEIDRRLPEDPHPDGLALYLTLGWAQATTTWQWPATERWIALLGGEPPSPWLARSQWHLCWLLYDANDTEHRRAFDEALAEGLDDAERPGVAEALRSIFPPSADFLAHR